MKHPKKKKRLRPSGASTKQAAGCQNPSPGQNGEEISVLKKLTEGMAGVSVGEKAGPFANREVDDGAEIFGNLTETASSSSGNREDDASEIFGNLTETASSSSGSSGLSNVDNYNSRMVGGKIVKGTSRAKKVVAATGMVSSVLGKDYFATKRREVAPKWKASADGPVSPEDAEQFLCSMLNDDCELGMAVVKDVLCQSAYDVEKALDILLELTASSSDLSKSGQHHSFSLGSKEDTQSLLELNDTLTDRTFDSASSSETDLQGNVSSMGFNNRNYFEVLAGSGAHPPPGHSNSSELPQEVLESLFNTPKSSKHEPSSMNWRNVVKKMESLGQRLDYPSEDTNEKHHIPAKGDDYQDYRNTASQHWDSMKSYYHKAATAYANGKREYAAYLSDQGRMCNKMARQADERASQDIFSSRNKSIENVITIDLHGQHVKQGMRLLKLHLLFGAYVRSVRLFRVITGCGSHGLGKSKLKQSVVNLLENEKIEWREENRGTLLIRLNGEREFSFLDSESDTE